jgi:hypothetical protein
MIMLLQPGIPPFSSGGADTLLRRSAPGDPMLAQTPARAVGEGLTPPLATVLTAPEDQSEQDQPAEQGPACSERRRRQPEQWPTVRGRMLFQGGQADFQGRDVLLLGGVSAFNSLTAASRTAVSLSYATAL